MQRPATPYYNKRIFWDADADKLDFDNKATFIIERVFERGDVEDIHMCRRYYQHQRIEQVLLNTRFLPLIKIYLCSAILQKPLTAFRCYTLIQSNPELYPYH
jgi:hypothetical protein